MRSEYVVKKVGLTPDSFRRIVSLNDNLYTVGKATGRNDNCLIDTIRQSLDLEFSHALLDAVRNDLAKTYSSGAFQVRTGDDVRGPNFLEFTEHTRSVAQLLCKHAGVKYDDVAGLKFICCDFPA